MSRPGRLLRILRWFARRPGRAAREFLCTTEVLEIWLLVPVTRQRRLSHPEGGIWKKRYRRDGRQGFEDKVCQREGFPPTNPLRVTHCCKTLRIHEGRSDYPMSPQKPQVCRIRKVRLSNEPSETCWPSMLPMRHVTPEGPRQRCVKVCA